eukprot:XP_017945574.1 PREDICTED: B-cell receptor CD22-like [Xenopus tropicalis]
MGLNLNVKLHSPKNATVIISDGKKEMKEDKAKNVTIKGKKEVKERAALELECHFSDYNPPTTQYSYSWYLNGNPVNGETGRILQINNITESHSGTYSCNVQNRAGRSNSTGFAVTVMYSPKNVTVVISDGKKERKEDDKVRLSCLSDANPAADNFIWYKHVRNEPKKRRPEQRQNITVTVGWDRDRFSCIARNPRGPGKSKILELQVLYKAKNVTIKRKDEVKEGAALELECHFSDYNPPTTQYSYSWYLNGNPVNGETGRILQINNITESHSGTYSCNVQNGAGPSYSPGFAVTLMSTQTGLPMRFILGGGAGAVFVILLVLGLCLVLRKLQKGEDRGGRRAESDYEDVHPTESRYTALQMRDMSDVTKNPQATESPYTALQTSDTDVYEVIKTRAHPAMMSQKGGMPINRGAGRGNRQCKVAGGEREQKSST